MIKNLLHTEGLAIGHGRVPLIRGIHAELPAGSLTAMIGVNGIGKSTLLKTLAGLLPPVEGRVMMGEEDVFRMAVSDRARRIAVVLTGRPDAGMLDVETLTGLGRLPWTNRWGRTNAADGQAVERALQRTGALHLRHRQVTSCSDGECQKVLIARALAQATPVLLLDEPTAFLDLPNRAEVVRVLRSIAHEEGKAVLFSTHDLQLAMDLCDRIILMRTGEGLWQGTAMEARASGELDRAFSSSGVRFDRQNGTHRFIP